MSGPQNFSAGHELIIIEIRGQKFAIDIISVVEIRGWSASTRLPHAPGHVLGMINLRGAVLPVIDFAVTDTNATVEVHYKGRPYHDVARDLGVPVGTVKSRVYYALKAMRLALDELGWSDDV